MNATAAQIALARSVVDRAESRRLLIGSTLIFEDKLTLKKSITMKMTMIGMIVNLTSAANDNAINAGA